MIAAMREDVHHRPGAPVRAGRVDGRAVGCAGLEKALASEWQIDLSLAKAQAATITDEDILERPVAAHAVFEAKVDLVGPRTSRIPARRAAAELRHQLARPPGRAGLPAPGHPPARLCQKQPKQEYKREAFELFRQLIDQVKNEVTRVLMTVQVQQPEAMDEAAAGSSRAEHVQGLQYVSADGDKSDAPEAFQLPEGARVGRNDPAPAAAARSSSTAGKLS
jgi:preprotein translocase subunit SecA